MTYSDRDIKNVDAFFDAITPLRDAYLYDSFSYIAIKRGDAFNLYRGRLFLNTSPSSIPHAHFQSTHVMAGHYNLAELQFDVVDFVHQLGAGTVKTPHGDLLFPGAEDGRHSTLYMPFHNQGAQFAQTPQNRLDVLSISGRRFLECIQQPHIDWELRSSATPYDGLQELTNEYRLVLPNAENVQVEIVAFNVAVVDLGSQISGTIARPAIIAAEGLDEKRISLGYRIMSHGRVVSRSLVNGTSMTWQKHDVFRRGEVDIEIPEGAVVHCVVSYSGIGQHQGWLIDPAATPNPKRAVYGAFDDKLEIIQQFIEKQGKGRDARDLEVGVAWLFWMLGFGVAHLGGTSKTQDAADLVVTTPNGHFAIVECTTGSLKGENKLSLLVERAEISRTALKASGNHHLRVLPIMVTSKTRDEVKVDLEQAVKAGVLVLTRESLEEGLKRTLMPVNADSIYEEGEQSLRGAQAQYRSQGSLPL